MCMICTTMVEQVFMSWVLMNNGSHQWRNITIFNKILSKSFCFVVELNLFRT